MDKFVIFGGEKLFGKLKLGCAKNAYLPIMAASILAEEKVVLKNMPDYLDIKNMTKILNGFGVQTKIEGEDLCLEAKDASGFCVPTNLAKELRSSIFVLGPLLAKLKKAKVAYPGGCEIGIRPIDLHLKGLRELGAKIIESHGYIYCDGTNMKPAVINFDYPSVGATENVMMAAVKLNGTTVIHNPAKEPEIVDLQNFLNSLGANISGAGTDEIKVCGVEKLGGSNYLPISDRIVGGTILVAAAMCGGKVCLENCHCEHFLSLTDKLQKSGCKTIFKNDKITIESSGRLKAIPFVETMPYPGFPTDLQSQVLAMQTISKGCSVIKENLFETRFKFALELLKMGANVKFSGQTAFVCGTENLMGADVFASDLRGGASLVLAGLCAKGYTTVHNIYHIDRGYDHLEKMLSSLGAKIRRESE